MQLTFEHNTQASERHQFNISACCNINDFQ